MTIIQALAMYPDIQRKAQKEIDAVIGDRLPTAEDSSQLPYVNAICQETLRWRPFAPFAAAHAAFRDDTYGDYFIPEGSIVMGNAWLVFLYFMNISHRGLKLGLFCGTKRPTDQMLINLTLNVFFSQE